ncbi:MAG: insulinase family protein, partial [Deltaproteobacteria bacterium]
VTAEDVQRVAARLLARTNSTVVVGRATQAPEGVTPTLHERPPAASDSAVEGREPAPPPTDLPRGEVIERTAHGATILAVHDETEPLLRLSISFKNGAAEDAIPGTANLAAKMLLRGTARRDRASFEEALERLGGSITAQVTQDRVSLSGSVPADAWPGFIALLTEALSQPAFDPATLEELKAEVRSELKDRADDDRALVARAFEAAWYGSDSPYGRDVRGTVRTLSDIDVDAVRAHVDRWFVSGAAVVGLSGAFDSLALDDLDAMLATIEGTAPERTAIRPVEPPATRRVLIVDKPERTQVQVMVGQRGFDPLSEDYPAFLLGNDVVGGYSFSAWLMKQVRVERGWSYYAYGANRPKDMDAAWIAVLAPGSDYAVDAVKLVLDVMDQGRGDLPTEEVELARSSRVNGAPFLTDTAPKRLDLAVEKALTGYDRAAVDAAVADVDEARAEAILHDFYDPEHSLIVMVATADDVKEAAAELGEVTVIPFTAVE